MLQPKRTKFRKKQKGRVKGIASRGFTINFGAFGAQHVQVHFGHDRNQCCQRDERRDKERGKAQTRAVLFPQVNEPPEDACDKPAAVGKVIQEWRQAKS